MFFVVVVVVVVVVLDSILVSLDSVFAGVFWPACCWRFLDSVFAAVIWTACLLVSLGIILLPSLDSVLACVFGQRFAGVFWAACCWYLWAAFCCCLMGSMLPVFWTACLLVSLDSVFAGVFGQHFCWCLWTVCLLVSLDSSFAGVFWTACCWHLLGWSERTKPVEVREVNTLGLKTV